MDQREGTVEILAVTANRFEPAAHACHVLLGHRPLSISPAGARRFWRTQTRGEPGAQPEKARLRSLPRSLTEPNPGVGSRHHLEASARMLGAESGGVRMAARYVARGAPDFAEGAQVARGPRSRLVRRAALAVVGLSTLAFAAPAAATTETFNHTGAAQTWTVPAGVTSATFDLYGAQGAGLDFPAFAPGLGGRATATIPVTPGASIEVNVGGQAVSRPGGFNGGGDGGGDRNRLRRRRRLGHPHRRHRPRRPRARRGRRRRGWRRFLWESGVGR